MNIFIVVLKVNPINFNKSQAELGQNLERTNTEGAQFRGLAEETRTANASIAPEVSRIRCREGQLSTRASAMRTELQGQLQNLQQEKTHISALMHQIQITNSSMNSRHHEFCAAVARQTPNSIDFRLTFLTCELRWRGINLPEIETQKNLRHVRESPTSLGRKNLRQSTEIERLTLSSHEAEMEKARTQSRWEVCEVLDQYFRHPWVLVDQRREFWM